MDTTDLRCEDVVRDATVERFLSGTLSPAERERFESHAIMCSQCQHAIELGMAIRHSFRSTGQEALSARTRRSGIWLSIAAVAAVLAVTTTFYKNNGSSGALEALGAVSTPPPYHGVAVRASDNAPGDNARGEAAFDSAMRAYAGLHYTEAIRALNAAIASGADVPPAHFFLGVSLLATDAPREASAEFSRVIDAGDSPYRTEAYYYRAKTYLKMHDRARARVDLDAAALDSGDMGAQARALRDSVARTGVR